jgi:hypothetical protein
VGTVVMVIRHGEKPGGVNPGIDGNGQPDDSSLTATGWDRARRLVDLFAPVSGPPRPGQLLTSAVSTDNGALFLLLLGFAIVVALVVVLLGYVVRVLLTVILIAGAPIALMFHALPQTEGIARWWWRTFGACLAIQVVQSLTLVTRTCGEISAHAARCRFAMRVHALKNRTLSVVGSRADARHHRTDAWGE